MQVSFESSVTVEVSDADAKAIGLKTPEDIREFVESFEGQPVDADVGRAWLVFVDADKAVKL